MTDKSEIILYQPNEVVSLEVRLENETVWLSQAQMAELFGTQRQAITKHLKIFLKPTSLINFQQVPFWNYFKKKEIVLFDDVWNFTTLMLYCRLVIV